MAKHFIFYSKKDIRINYSIIAEHQKMLVIRMIFQFYVKYTCVKKINKKNIHLKKIYTTD